MKKKVTRLFSVLLAAVLVFGTLPVSALGTDVVDPPASTVDESVVDESVVDESSAEPEEEPAVDDAAQVEEQSAEEEAVVVQSGAAVDGYDMNVLLLDCGRKYYSVDSIKTFINEAHDAGFNYIQLVVGNEGLRFLLNDMSLTVDDTTYDSSKVKAAIQAGNAAYNKTVEDTRNGHAAYTPDKNELTQSEMDTIIDYAHEKSMGVIPCINSPGHMYTMLSVAQSLTGQTNYAYSGSTSRVNVSNPEKEQDVTYQNIWDVAENSFVGFTDKKGEVTGTVQEYIANGGPQNEIYLTNSHAVVFQGDKQSTIQVSLRAVKDNDPVTVNLGNGVTKEITSVTEMYYEVTSNENGVFTIANTGDGILAIGNVKLPSDVTEITSAQDLGDDMVSKVLTAALYGNPEPDPEPDPATFAPETFETKVSSSTVIRNKVVTLKVTVSSDVAYITVNGKKYTRTGLKGFGGKNRTIRVVSVMPKDETPNFEIVAYNANGEKSATKSVSE